MLKFEITRNVMLFFGKNQKGKSYDLFIDYHNLCTKFSKIHFLGTFQKHFVKILGCAIDFKPELGYNSFVICT